MTDPAHIDPASAFVAEWVTRLTGATPARALDLAAGRGRHAALLARAGHRVFAVDRAYDVIHNTVTRLAQQRLTIAGWCADLTTTALPRAFFDLIVVTRYLQRDLCPAIAEALAPGGVLIYETFTEAQRRHGRGPTSPDHLLQPGELRQRFDRLEMLFYEEVDVPDAVARLVGRNATSRS